MYFTPELQKRTLQLFAFALRDGGYLALGKAESAKELGTYFEAAHRHQKLYRRHGERVLAPIARMMASDAYLPFSLPSVLPSTLESARPTDGHVQPPIAVPRGTLVPAAVVRYVTPTPLPEMPNGHRGATGLGGEIHSRSTSESLGNLLLEAEVGVVVVDQEYDIQTINAAARHLLGIYRVAVGNDLIHLVHNVPTTVLRQVIDAAFHLPNPGSTLEFAFPKEGEADSVAGLLSEDGDTIVTVETLQGEPRDLQITCYPQRQQRQHDLKTLPTSGPEGTSERVERVLVLVSDVTRLVRKQRAAFTLTARAEAERQLAQTGEDEPGDRERAHLAKTAEVDRLQAQMAAISLNNRALARANQELAEVNREMRSAADESLVGREEAEANAEEIKTLNEELQATNEELVTVNEELEATVEELHTANEDLGGRSRELQRLAASLEQQSGASEAARAQLEAILLSMGDALLVVDRNGVPILTNAAYVRLFGSEDARLVAEDEQGQPLPPEQQPNYLAVRGAAFRLQFTQRAVDGTRRWFEASGEPVYSGSIEHGGVITIRDITERHVPQH